MATRVVIHFPHASIQLKNIVKETSLKPSSKGTAGFSLQQSPKEIYVEQENYLSWTLAWAVLVYNINENIFK